MEFTKQFSNFPNSFEIIKNEFYSYDPNLVFEESLSFYYLSEDLLQIHLESKNITLDLGWYGDLSNNKGCFKISIIGNEDWQNPLEIIKSKSQTEISEKLKKIIEKYNKSS
ncbi:hypothetical protein [uncultured Flavobacterium sp.]|jgi:hypothetical protein|uniref:hypothetical protein n=1 Tax=uncultured Flavobacterium sp. TaxID=165435 RepID=UPI0030ECDD64|tara:strand:+ start:513 stop:845 length:333 start_codon:yes stop_codon:yes gene_type:complete